MMLCFLPCLGNSFIYYQERVVYRNLCAFISWWLVLVFVVLGFFLIEKHFKYFQNNINESFFLASFEAVALEQSE